MSEEQIKIWFANCPVLELARFCKENGYCVVIEDSENYYVTKEYGR